MIRPTRSNSRIAAWLWAALLPQTPVLATDFEAPAVVPAAQLLGELPLRGEGYEIRSEATIVDFYGRFVVQTDLGLFAVDGVDLLQQRLAEMPAARVLEEASALVVLGDTAQRRLRRPFEQGAKVASEPGSTAKRVPQGLGRFLSRTARRAQKLFWRIGDAASDRWRRNDQPAAANESETPERESSKLAAAQSIGLDYIGYDKARRELAQRLGIDPYTSHPLINQRLDDLAWSAWVGNKSASLMLGAVVGGALDQALDISGDAYRLAWAESPMDIELARQPASSADRWHARLYLLAPLLRIILALTWIASGVVGLLLDPATQDAISMAAGMTPTLGRSLGVALSAADIVLGVWLLVSMRPARVLALMLAFVVGYTLSIGTLLPEYWLDPFGGLLKNGVIAMAILVAMATADRS